MKIANERMESMSQEPVYELSERKKLILKAIVDAHIAEGEPVGSKYLMESKQIPCSSATIRNEMAELEAMGFLEQPHTSAGRVPSERGYRFYVDSLVEHYAMTAREIYQINELLQAKMAELDQILLTASKVASNLTNYTAMAIKPKSNRAAIRRFDAVYMDEKSFILVLVASGNRVKTKNVRLGDDVNVVLHQSTTDLLAAVLNEHLQNLSANEITLPIMMSMETAMGKDAALIAPVVKIIYEVMSEIDGGEVRVSGVDRLLQYPEFSQPDRMKEILGAFEKQEEILNMVSGAAGDDISVVIGSESSVKVMDNSALVYKPIVKDGKTLGAIAILGPARMDYAKVLATLEGLSGNITSLLDQDHKSLPNGRNQENDG
ncbi:MAG: heat-inducible transcription repressor HrcA [Ruminococcaceae bacterium]|nr:heat-inducible transcription repressor HrcA [Oscillospiraceae bacterium]